MAPLCCMLRPWTSQAIEVMCWSGQARRAVWWVAVVGLVQSGSSGPLTEGSALCRRRTPSGDISVSLPGSTENHTVKCEVTGSWRWPLCASLGDPSSLLQYRLRPCMLQPGFGSPQPGLLEDTCLEFGRGSPCSQPKARGQGKQEIEAGWTSGWVGEMVCPTGSA